MKFRHGKVIISIQKDILKTSQVTVILVMMRWLPEYYLLKVARNAEKLDNVFVYYISLCIICNLSLEAEEDRFHRIYAYRLQG
jgi:hypothetical protein